MTLLIADYDYQARDALRHRFKEEGYTILEAQTGEQAWSQFESGVDLVLLAESLPDTSGLSLLERMTVADADVPVIMVADPVSPSVDHAVKAMKAGAYHYTAKPLKPDEMSIVVQRALHTTRLKRRSAALSGRDIPDLERIIGDSPPIQDAKRLIRKVAESPSSTVLLTGESGTGKDLAARVIHQISSRREGPFLNITCSALTASLFESELFGHERGAFTDAKDRKKGLLEQAHTGTVFLDEISEMPLEMQAKLLRFLEEKTFRRVGSSVDIRANVRAIAASNVDLRQAVQRGEFREDLYFRLAVLEVDLPPLRVREGDLHLLVEYFIQHFNQEFNRRVTKISSAALNALSAYTWPGNVRELRNAIERAVLLADSPTLTKADFPMLQTPSRPETAEDFLLPPAGLDFVGLERSMVQQALDRAKGNRTLAATLLGMNRDQIRYRIDKFGLEDS